MIYVSFLNDKKNTSKKKNILVFQALLPYKPKTLEMFKLEKKWKEGKLQNQVNGNQTEDNSNVIH